MKKILFAMSVVSMALASCSSDEPTEVNKGRAIEFRHGMTSRAADLTAANLSSFQAYAFVDSKLYFGPVEFTGTDGTFSSVTSYYWPGDGSTVDFTAFAPAALAATVTAQGTVTLNDFTVDADKTKQVDFITGIGSGNKAANEATGVKLSFGHVLSQIEIKAKSNNDIYDFEISGVKLVNIPNKGSYDGSKWTLAEGDNAATYEHTFDAVTLDKNAAGEPNVKTLMGKDNGNTNLILIPQQLTAWEPTPNDNTDNTGAYIAVKLKVTSKNGDVQIFPFTEGALKSEWAAVPVGTKWEAGKKYTYVLDFTAGAGWVEPGEDIDPEEPIFKDPIKFTVEVSDWGVEGAGDQAVEMKTDND